MKRNKLIAFGVGAALMLAAGSASAACTARINIKNENASKQVNILSCSTQRKGKSNWNTSLFCATFAVAGNLDVVDPGKEQNYVMVTSRKPNKEFKFKITYKYVGEGGVMSRETNYSTCKKKGHRVTLS